MSRSWLISVFTTVLVACGEQRAQPAAPPTIATPAAPMAPCADRPAAKPRQDADLDAIEGAPILAVCFHGVSAEVGRELARYVRLQDGGIFTRAQADDDLHALWKSMLIEDLRLSARPAPAKAIVLDYDVTMRPRITQVSFHGATAFGDALLAKSFPFHEESVLSLVALRTALHALEGVYEERGYPNVRASYSVELASPGAVKLRIDVEEGPLVRVRKLAFSGLQKVKERELEGVLGEKTGDPYNRERVDRDALLVVDALHDRGLIEAKVETRPTIAGDAATITFAVTEGRRFKIGKLSMTGEPIGKERELLASLATKPGAVFNRSVLMQDIKALELVADRKGLAVEIAPESEVDPKAQTVSVSFHVTAQPR